MTPQKRKRLANNFVVLVKRKLGFRIESELTKKHEFLVCVFNADHEFPVAEMLIKFWMLVSINRDTGLVRPWEKSFIIMKFKIKDKK